MTGLNRAKACSVVSEQRERHVDRCDEEEQEHRHLHQRPGLDGAQPHRDPGCPEKAAEVHDHGERVEADDVDRPAAHLHSGDQGDDRQERGRDAPAQERRHAVADHDPDPVRRGQQQPAREASLEVPGDAEAGEDAAECGGLEQHEHELERGVAVRVVEAGGVLHLRQASGEGDEEEEREHQRRDHERRRRDHVLEGAPGDAGCNGPDVHDRSSRLPISRLATMTATIASTIAMPNPSARASASQPVMIRLRTHSIR